MRSRAIITPSQAQEAAKMMTGLALPFTLTWREGASRSLSANALLHKWYGEIAQHFGDRTAKEVKGQCHHEYGLHIRLRDDVFAWVWKHSGANLPYDKQCALLASETLGVSSKMSARELTEYMEPMSADYRAQGVFLTDPEARKYENEFLGVEA